MVQVLTEHMGQPTLIYREGGSIPALVLMRKHLGLESTMFAFGLPDDNLHSPNEVWALLQPESFAFDPQVACAS